MQHGKPHRAIGHHDQPDAREGQAGRFGVAERLVVRAEQRVASPHYRGEGVLIHPQYQGVCGRHGMEEQRVTSGGLTPFAGGTAISRPISESEVGSDVVSVVGLPE